MAWIQTTQQKFSTPRRCALIIAHPDDEVMFFSPLLNALENNGSVVFVLCLSTGNFEGLGKQRIEELYASAALHHIPREMVTIIDHPHLQDGMETVWPIDTISNIVQEFLQREKVEMVSVV